MSKLNLEQLTNLYTLLSIEGIGPGKIRTLLAKFRSTENILSADKNSLLGVDGISTNLAGRIRKANHSRNEIKIWVEKQLTILQKMNAEIVTIWDENYPNLLKKIFDPPLLLQIKGSLSESDQYAIAMVGTRQPTNYGKVLAERISSDLADKILQL